MGSVENLLIRLETFRRTVAGRTGRIGFPSRLSIINCRWPDEGKLGASREQNLGVRREARKDCLSSGKPPTCTNA